MKKVWVLLLVLISGLLLTSCGEADLKILLPTAYLEEELVKQFEKENKVKVKTISFASNEAAISRLKRETFDLMIPSDYAIEQMIEEDLLLPIEWDKIDLDRDTGYATPLMSIIRGYEEAEKPVPLLDYAVPYFWGSLGIIYNAQKEGLAELLEEEGWGAFLDSSLKKVVYDSSRDGFALALKYLGYSVNSNNETELQAAEALLNQIKDSGKVLFLTDQIMDDMPDLKHDIALTYNGDAVYVRTQQPNVGFHTPKQGTNVFVDALVIPKKSRNVELAYKFINFISEHDNAVVNAETVCYVSAIKTVYEYMITDETSAFYDHRDIYMVEYNEEKDELFRYIPSVKRFMDDAWARVRTR